MTPEQLEDVNAKLAARDYMVMEEDSGRLALYRIERCAIPMHGTRYDRYVRITARSRLTPELKALWRAIQEDTNNE